MCYGGIVVAAIPPSHNTNFVWLIMYILLGDIKVFLIEYGSYRILPPRWTATIRHSPYVSQQQVEWTKRTGGSLRWRDSGVGWGGNSTERWTPVQTITGINTRPPSSGIKGRLRYSSTNLWWHFCTIIKITTQGNIVMKVGMVVDKGKLL